MAAYLASKYGKDDSLYPKDLETRYMVDQRLYFDMGQFYKVRGDVESQMSNQNKQLTGNF